ncbi:Protein FAR1-RELATED SEQUENCE 5 [Platanthera zijinensis]|uniref:Protein FAR1-RELATED SEQUENCE n=1 Tax=Platanthera zijinensis TaxID=2320716 RepID=A0AAP0AVI6_9ASPA
MSTTQRSEGINAFFNGYVNSKTTLKQFVEQYENVLRSKVVKEQNADFKSFNSWIPCVTFYAMEKQIQDMYTNSKFKEFQLKLTSIMYCKSSLLDSVDLNHYYEVSELKKYGENDGQMRRINFNVSFLEKEDDEIELQCICKLFEFCGILCRHILLIMVENNIFLIPSKYILQRWRKDIKRHYTKSRVTYSNWKDTDDGRRFDKMSSVFNEIANLSYESEENCTLVIERLEDLKIVLKNKCVNNGRCSSISANLSKTTSMTNNQIKSPVDKRGKGRPPINRKRSKIDIIVDKLRKKKSQGTKRSKGQKKEVIFHF